MGALLLSLLGWVGGSPAKLAGVAAGALVAGLVLGWGGASIYASWVRIPHAVELARSDWRAEAEAAAREHLERAVEDRTRIEREIDALEGPDLWRQIRGPGR